MREIKFELNKEQMKHLKSIQWLFDEDNRQSGISLLPEYVFIVEALKGRTIKIIDHAYITTGAGYRANKMLAECIQDIIIGNKLPLKINWSSLELSRK